MKIAAYALAGMLVSTAAFAEDRAGWPESFTVATASQGGTYFAYGSGRANLVGEELGLTGGGEVTGGPGQNMALVHTGDTQFGMTTMGPAAEAIAGESPIAPGLQMTNACAMFPMYQTPFAVTTLASTGITEISDIPDGARIGFGPAGSTSDTYFPRMMEELGVNFERRNGGWNDLAGQLQDGLLDVIAFAAHDYVITKTTCNRVIAAIAIEHLISRLTHNRIVGTGIAHHQAGINCVLTGVDAKVWEGPATTAAFYHRIVLAVAERRHTSIVSARLCGGKFHIGITARLKQLARCRSFGIEYKLFTGCIKDAHLGVYPLLIFKVFINVTNRVDVDFDGVTGLHFKGIHIHIFSGIN